MRFRGLAVRIGGCVLVLAWGVGCGEATTEDVGRDPDTAPTPPVATTDGEVIVSCGGGDGWPPSVMSEGVSGLLSDDDARRTFQEILDDPRYAAEAELTLFSGGVDVEYRVLRGDETSLTLGLGRWTSAGPAARDTYVLDLEREGSRWIPGGWGSCTNLGPVLRDGLSWARVDGYHAEASDTTVTISVSELDCTGSRDPRPFLHDPVVVETDDAVTVYATTTPMTEAATCPGNPSVELEIELDEPLGERRVLDGSLYPAHPAPRR